MSKKQGVISGIVDKIKHLGAVKEVPETTAKELASDGIAIPLALDSIASAFNTNFTPTSTENRYVMYRRFMKMDPELNNAITKLALLAQFAYKGVIMNTDSTPTAKEKEILENATKEAEELDLRSKFFTISKHVLRDGDAVFVAALAASVGVQQIQHLPMSLTTCVAEEKQIGEGNAIIQQRNIYVVNESSSEKGKRSTFPVNDPDKPVFHVSMDNEAEEVYDNLNRYTFGVWSESPIDCLKTQVLWKQAVKITDILWRYRNVPREVHKLDTSMFTPDKFAGADWEAQIAAAMAAAQTYLNAYAKNISGKNVDQGYVVGSNVVEITYAQPGGKTGAPQSMSKNNLIEQINESIREGAGAYSVGKGTYATELVTASYVILMPDWVAYKTRRELTRLLRKHLMLKYGYKSADVDRININLNLVLDILKGEVARQVALIAAADIKTDDELRAMLGDQPLTEKQKREIRAKRRSKTAGRTSPIQTGDDQVKNAGQSSATGTGGAPITPQSRNDKQMT